MNPVWKAPMRSNAEPWPPSSYTLVPRGSRTVTNAIIAVRTSSSVNDTVGASPRQHVRRPRPGEAVGLLLGVHGGLVAVEVAGAALDGVAELVGEHDGDHRRPVGVGELGEHPLGAVVVGHEVALVAVEGAVVGHLLVGGGRLGSATRRDLARALRVGGVDAARERPEGIAEQCGVLGRPPRLDVGERSRQVRVVVPRRLGVADVDDGSDRRPRRRSPGSASPPARWWPARWRRAR